MNRKWRRDCPYCGICVGIVGNWMAILFGTRIHSCDFSKYTFSKYLEMHSNVTRTPQADKEEKCR